MAPTPLIVASGAGVPFLAEIVAVLAAAVVVVPLARRMKVSPVLGYLVAGLALGPSGLALTQDADSVRRMAELGVIFLLFTIGLELSFDKLARLRRWVFGLGASQVGLTAVVIAGATVMLGQSAATATVIGLGLALSSTAIVLQILSETGERRSATGNRIFAVLLFQDIAVVPILITVTLLGGEGGDDPLTSALFALVKAVAVVAAILLPGRILLRWLYRVVAGARNVEVFLAMSLLGALAAAWLTEIAGLSSALGAFLAGLLLSETEFRHQIESDIQPFRGLLLGLFFMAVGMGLDIGALASAWPWVVGGVVALMVLKASIVFGLALAMGSALGQSIRMALLLAQSGEFVFVILSVAGAYGTVPAPVAQFVTLVAIASMLATPLLAIAAGRLAASVERGEPAPDDLREDDDREGHVIIAGYGRVGQTLGRLLQMRDIPYLALDLSASCARAARARGSPCHYGDAGNADVLRTAGIERAAALVLTLDEHENALRVLRLVREQWPDLAVFARARDQARAQELSAAGATRIIPETFESSLALSAAVLRHAGESAEAVNALIEELRVSHYAAIADTGDGNQASVSANSQSRKGGNTDDGVNTRNAGVS